jgi:hypothetical protein
MANERLRDAIMSASLTPDEIAPRLDVDPKTVERWITTNRVPYPRYRHKLAALLRKSESYLWPDAVSDHRATEIMGSAV